MRRLPSALRRSCRRHIELSRHLISEERGWLKLALGVLGCATAVNVLGPAAADAAAVLSLTRPTASRLVLRTQSRGQHAPTINVGRVILAEPATDTPFPIHVGPADGIPKNSFVRIRGLPPSTALSEGHSIAPGSWAVPFVGLPTLRLTVPVGLSGKSEVVIALVTVDGTVLAEIKTSLVIASASLIAPGRAEPQPKNVASINSAVSTGSADAAGRPAEHGASVVPKRSTRTPEQERAVHFVKKGNEFLAEGDVSTARLYYQRAVDAGLSEGALAMAESYDPAELGRLGVRGLEPDPELARRWYERARQLGAPEAEGRLKRLGAR